MTSFKLIAVVMLSMMLGTRWSEQTGSEKYVVGFRDLKARLDQLSTKADVAERGTAAAKLQFGKDASRLRTLIDSLGEHAGEANDSGIHQGRDPDKNLLRVVTAAESLSVEITALGAFVDTGDRTFRAAANDADAVATNLARAM